ncbi:TPA: hypothetical protein MIU18_23870 [Klebsiella pneumoniae]|nr:hypothetical protein DMR10_22940 [Klebsiella pneumoniae]HBY4361368.1 hypothetical protein [Klebsiella pneumoniae]
MTMHLMSFNLNHFRRRKQGLFSIINSFHIERRNCQLPLAGVACNQHSERVRSLDEKGRDSRFGMAGDAAGAVVDGARLAGYRQ